jgi:thiamine monophosphate kinase
LADGVAEVARQLGVAPAELAATAGEDYELCVCMAADAAAALGELVTVIGRVEGVPEGGEPGLTLGGTAGGPPLRGHEHPVG